MYVTCLLVLYVVHEYEMHQTIPWYMIGQKHRAGHLELLWTFVGNPGHVLDM